MKYCMEYAALLDPFVDGELSPEEAARVRAHLKVCGGCRSYVDAALAMRDAFPEWEDTEVPEGFADGVMAAIRTEAGPQAGTESQMAAASKRPKPWKKVLLPMAACLAIVAAVGQLPQWNGASSAAATDAASQSIAAASAGSEESQMETAMASQSLPGPVPAEGDAPLTDEITDHKTAFAIQNSTVSDASGESAPALQSRETGKAEADEAPKELASPMASYSRWAQVALTAEQQERLLGAYVIEPQTDGTALCLLTAEEFDTVLAALDAEGLTTEVQENGDVENDLCCLSLLPD